VSPGNEVLDPVWAERVVRLRLGIGAVDALGRPGVVTGLTLHGEDRPRPTPLPADPRVPVGDDAGLPGVGPSPTGRFALAFPDREPTAPPARITVRLVDRSRRYVPRRLSIPAPTRAAVVAGDVAHAADPTRPLTPRACRPALFPGANYGLQAGATVLRGSVLSAGVGTPRPWARVTARTAAPIVIVDDQGVETAVQPVLGRAHGDDRGEFLLVVGSMPRDVAVLQATPTIDLEVRVAVRPFPAAAAPVTSPTGSRRDPLWHLPIEVVADLDQDDEVTRGVAVPAGYTSVLTTVVTVRRGTVSRPAVPFFVP
jgi:hypothetical protein